jgi:hypothetical protein
VRLTWKTRALGVKKENADTKDSPGLGILCLITDCHFAQCWGNFCQKSDAKGTGWWLLQSGQHSLWPPSCPTRLFPSAALATRRPHVLFLLLPSLVKNFQSPYHTFLIKETNNQIRLSGDIFYLGRSNFATGALSILNSTRLNTSHANISKRSLQYTPSNPPTKERRHRHLREKRLGSTISRYLHSILPQSYSVAFCEGWLNTTVGRERSSSHLTPNTRGHL